MAQIDPNQAQQDRPETVDPFDQTLTAGYGTVIDPTEDAWEALEPPPPGRYRLRLHLGDRGFQKYYFDQNDPNSVYYACNLECTIEGTGNPDIDGRRTFPRVSTAIRRGRNISTMVGLLLKLGYQIPTDRELSHLDQMRMFAQVLKTEPVCDAFCDWQGWSRADEEVKFFSRADFPDAPGGGKQHVVVVNTRSGGREEITASLRVKEWFGVGSVAAAPVVQSQPVAQPAQPAQTVPPVTPVTAAPTVPNAAPVPPVAAPAPPAQPPAQPTQTAPPEPQPQPAQQPAQQPVQQQIPDLASVLRPGAKPGEQQ